MITQHIQTLLTRFHNGIKAFDFDVIKQCYHLPCTINTPDSMTLVTTGKELETEFLGIFEQLKNEGLASFTCSNTRYSPINDTLFLAEIDWQFIDVNKVIFSEFAAFYHIQFIEEQFKIVNATSHHISNKQQLLMPFSLTTSI